MLVPPPRHPVFLPPLSCTTQYTCGSPGAGKKAGSEELREAVFDLRDKGHDVQVRVTYESSDAERYVQVTSSSLLGAVIVCPGCPEVQLNTTGA